MQLPHDGRYDFFLNIMLSDRDDYYPLVLNKLAKVSNVESLQFIFVLQQAKRGTAPFFKRRMLPLLVEGMKSKTLICGECLLPLNISRLPLLTVLLPVIMKHSRSYSITTAILFIRPR